ncbi:MAG: DUF1552 domain-containing protein [Myxococcota bacterium]
MTFSRRQVLRGAAGSLLALPLLESLRPRASWSGAPVAPRRGLWWCTPNGHNMEDWTPAELGPGYALSPILTPFAAFQDRMTVISGLRNYGVSPLGSDSEGHNGAAAWLNCASTAAGGDISIDQLIAAQVGTQTPFASLELGMVAPGGGHPMPISWAGTDAPLPKVVSAPALFSRLFGSASTLSPEELERRTTLRLSVLDDVLGDLQSLHPTLPQTDRVKLDQYTTALRELEVRIEQTADLACEAGPPPTEHTLDAMCALIALAFECDLTRVVSFMWNNEGTNTGHPELGIPDAYHGLSHHNYDPDILAQLTTIQTWQAQSFVDSMVVRLASMTDLDGNTLLDNTTILYGSGMGDSHYHDNFDLPSLLLGGTHTFAHGHHMMAVDAPLADLHLAIAASMGASISTLGPASTGPLAGLT